MKPPKILISGLFRSGKSTLARAISNKSPNAVLMDEEYSQANRFLPLFLNRLEINGVHYNQFAYGCQLLFMQNRVRRETLCKDPSKYYVIDRSIYEDRHIFAFLMSQLGIMSKDEYNDYRNMFEKIVRNMDPPDTFILLNADAEKCFARVKARNKPSESWITYEIMQRFDELYRYRLKDRVLRSHPKINMIEIDTSMFKTPEAMAEEALAKLCSIYGERFLQ